MERYDIHLGKVPLWIIIYIGIMLFYTFLDVAVWRKILPKYSNVINLLTMIISLVIYISMLKKTGYQIKLLTNVSFIGIILAIGCSVLFFLLLDKCLDPIFESAFPKSEQSYQETIKRLTKSPITSLIQVGIVAPIIEEILMRGFVLDTLKNTYGITIALLISSILFALMHFNMVQTLSAFICGIILGLLYIKTGSILSCMIAHCGYNLISYIVMIYFYRHK